MSVRKDPKRGWVVHFVFTHAADGRKEEIRKTSPVQTRVGAEEYERQLRASMLNPKPVAKECPTLAEFSREFLGTYVKTNCKKSVQEDRESLLRVWILPAFGTYRLDAIGTREFEKLKAAVVAKDRAPKTANNVVAALSRVLGYAVEVGVLESKPKLRLLKVPPQRFDFLTFGELDRLVAVLHTEPLWGSAILASGDGGYRVGEILGMHREDVDHDAGVITVRRAMWRGHLDSPKGGRERKVPMTKRLARALKAARHLKGPFVWCEADGGYLTRKMAQRALERACRRAGLRPIGWHVLRHTFCSHLAMRGAVAKSIQELAGHTDLKTTQRYTHLAPAALHQAIELLEEPEAPNSTYAAREEPRSAKGSEP
ncbi:MAG: tyrosine-type recombinase/integrase [Deltaproteobacteria bacterium]|nr:tyrosine-type recombinase/integrase [Deltaproteobacteria bacterium]